MSEALLNGIIKESIMTVIKVAGPFLATGLIIGLIISIIQATTQIQEQTLAFVPKIVAVLVGIVVFGPWMLGKVTTYASDIFENLGRYVG